MPSATQRGEVAVRRGEHAHVDLDLLRAADAIEAELIERAEQLALQLGRQLGDAVEEEGAAGRELHQSELPLVGAGEGAALVAEQLALEHPFGERGAPDVDEGTAAPGQPMQHVRDELLARARTRR